MFLFEVLLNALIVFCIVTYVSCITILTINVISDWKDIMKRREK